MMPSFSGDLWIPLVFIIFVALVFSGKLGNKDRKNIENTERFEKNEEDHVDGHVPTPHVDHGASHGSSGGHDGGHGHGGGILSKLVTLVFLVVCGFGIYWFVQELHNIPPKTQHPIQVATGESKPLDTNPASYCKAPAPDATSYPAKPEEWTEVSVTPGGYEFCTNPGPASGLVEFECKMDEGGSWESCGQTFLFVRFKSKMPVTVWQESYHS